MHVTCLITDYIASTAGKTTLAEAIRESLGGHISYLSHDNYYKVTYSVSPPHPLSG